MEGGLAGKLRQATVITWGKVNPGGFSGGVRAGCRFTPLVPLLLALRAGPGAALGGEAQIPAALPRP